MLIYEVNAATGEIIDRKPTAAELAQRALDSQAATEKEFIEAQRAVDKAELLERLGITADEAALLLS